MVKMSEMARQFLTENCPEALKAKTVREVLETLYDDIDEKGFGGNRMDEYNDYGRAAQRVYDDILLNAEDV